MSRSKARYSLRSRCQNTACDCRNSSNLTCRPRRNGRLSSLNTSASNASFTPSEFSDAGSEEFDDISQSFSSPRISEKNSGVISQNLFSENTNGGSQIQINYNSTVLLTSVNQSLKTSSNLLSSSDSNEMRGYNGSRYIKNNNGYILSSGRLEEEETPKWASWFLKFKYIGFPIYWLLVHIVLIEKWFLRKEDKLEEDHFNTYVNHRSTRGSSYLMHREGSVAHSVAGSVKGGSVAGSVTGSRIGHGSYSHNGHFSSTPTTTIGGGYSNSIVGDNVVSNNAKTNGYGKFAACKTAIVGGKKMVSVGATKLFNSIDSRRFGSGDSSTTTNTKSTLLMWKKNGGQIEEETVNEMCSELKNNIRMRSHQQQRSEDQMQQHLQQSAGYVLGDSSSSVAGSVRGSVRGSVSSKDGYATTNGRMQKKGYELRNQFDSDEEEEDDNGPVQPEMTFWICKFLLPRVFGVLVLGYLAYLLWPAGASLAYWIWDFVSSCLSTLTTGAFSFLASFVPVWSSDIKTNIDQPKVPLTEHLKTTDAEVRNNLPQPLAPAISKEDYEAILQKLRRIEDTLEVFQEKLTFHEINHIKLQNKIVQLDAAMKAATPKGKSPDEILLEIMNFRVGVTSDGTSVTLRSLMTVLNKQDAQANADLDLKLQAMAEKFKEDTQSLEDKFKIVDEELNSLKEKPNDVVIETRTVTAEVDFEKLKGSIVPDLMAEMEKQVKISCLTRDCPEVTSGPTGGIMGGPSTTDVEKLIDMAIAKYDADKTGLPDLALESAGGSILSTRCTKSSKLRNSVVSLWGFRIWSPPNNPRTVIQPGVVPGECWAFEGSVGDVVIRLVSPSIVTGFTLEHIPKAITPYGNIESAPFKFQVIGLHAEDDLDSSHDYGTFSYEDNGEPLQYFTATHITATPYPIVELKILSNHGNLLYTCLYRFRVHGSLVFGGSQFTATVQTASEV